MKKNYYFTEYIWDNIKAYIFPTSLEILKKKRVNKWENCTWTKYPKIFNCYWGWFRSLVEIDIILNRNRFVKDYNIKRLIKRPQYVELDSNFDLRNCVFFDHTECYLDEDKNYILITSPYHPHQIVKGWEQIYSLYMKGVKTFLIKILAKKNRV